MCRRRPSSILIRRRRSSGSRTGGGHVADDRGRRISSTMTRAPFAGRRWPERRGGGVSERTTAGSSTTHHLLIIMTCSRQQSGVVAAVGRCDEWLGLSVLMLLLLLLRAAARCCRRLLLLDDGQPRQQQLQPRHPFVAQTRSSLACCFAKRSCWPACGSGGRRERTEIRLGNGGLEGRKTRGRHFRSGHLESHNNKTPRLRAPQQPAGDANLVRARRQEPRWRQQRLVRRLFSRSSRERETTRQRCFCCRCFRRCCRGVQSCAEHRASFGRSPRQSRRCLPQTRGMACG